MFFLGPVSDYESNHDSEDEPLAEPLVNRSGIRDSRYSDSSSLLRNNHSSSNNDVQAESFSSDTQMNEQEVESTEHYNIEAKPQKRKVVRTVEKEEPVRKRRKQPEKWIDNVAKTAEDKGESYVNRAQKTISAKSLGPGCSENCRLKCHNRISTIQRYEVFTYFWNLKEQIRKWNFIIKHTGISDVKSHTTHWDSRRNKTRKYFLNINNEKVSVCKQMFMETLAINESWIRTVFNKINNEEMISPDKKGKHSKRSQLAEL